MAATRAAGGQQIPKHSCGSSSVPGKTQLLEGRTWRETCEWLNLATGFAGVQPRSRGGSSPGLPSLPWEDPSGE